MTKQLPGTPSDEVADVLTGEAVNFARVDVPGKGVRIVESTR